MPVNATDSHDEALLFEQTERTLRLARTRLGLAVGTVLMPAGFMLDRTFYASQFVSLTTVRMLATIFLLISWVLVPRTQVGRWIYPFSVFALAVPGFAIAAMIGITDGASSNYFFGLILLMVIGQLVGFTGTESMAYSGLTITAFVIAVFIKNLSVPLQPDRLVLSLFFLVTTAVVCVLLCQANFSLRQRDFWAKQKLDASNRELEVKNRQLEELDRLRGAFLAAVSHELKTPITMILAPLDNLLSTRQAISEPVGQELAIVRRSADRLRFLIDDLLDIVRLDNAVLKFDQETIDGHEFAAQIATSIRPLAETRGLRLESVLDSRPTKLRIDIQRMERVLMNLLTNAIKFSPPQAVVQFRYTVVGDDHVRFEVIDQGPGIPSDEQTKVFERFYQASNNRLRSSQGLGLGLALSREIVRQHQGEIDLVSQEGHGSCFTVTLPAEAGIAAENRTPIREITVPVVSLETTKSEQPIDVLVVDDEFELREFLVKTISTDARVLGVSTGVMGIETAIRETPSVIVLDLMLPDISGLEVLRKLRAAESLNDSRVLMVTAANDETVKLQALALGADDFLGKPFGMSELKARVAALLRSSRLQRDLRKEREALAESLVQLKLAETKLFQSEKMRAIGSLAAGLLHEINNPVNITLMAIEVLKRDAAKGRDVSDVAEDIRSGIQRIGDIVSDLRRFAHPGTESPAEEFVVADAVDQALRFGAFELKGIELEFSEARASQITVRAQRNQLVQLILNALLNAAEAIRRCPDGRAGKISIEIIQQDARVQIAIRDNGIGISAADLPRVTEPFFTTAEPGKGLGLGLSICDSIVRNHNGQLTIHSETNRGTTVTFYLPSDT